MSIYTKLANFKNKVGVLKKDQRNDHFKNSFVDINSIIRQIEPVLESVKLGYMQVPFVDNEKPYLKTIIFDLEDDTKDERLESVLPLVSTNANDPQKLGSAITYMRRYALVAMLGLEVTDDDARVAAKPPKVVDMIDEDQILEVEGLIAETQSDKNKLLGFYGVTNLNELTLESYGNVVAQLKKKKGK